MTTNISILLLCSVFSVARVAASETDLEQARFLRAEIGAKGARDVLDRLYGTYTNDENGEWNAVLRSISTGEAQWLRIAVALRGASDAGTTFALDNAVNEALANSPNNVLSIAYPVFGLEVICGEPSSDDNDYADRASVIRATDIRIDRVSIMRTKALTHEKTACLSLLYSAKKRLTERKTGK